MSQELTMKEVCSDLKISLSALYVIMAQDKTFTTYKAGGSRRMSRSDLDAWKKKQKEQGYEKELVSAA